MGNNAVPINFFKFPKKRCSRKFGESCTAKEIDLYKIPPIPGRHKKNKEYIIFKTHYNSNYYHNEKKIYHLLQNEDFLPKLKYYDDDNLILGITDVGNAWSIRHTKLKDYEKELIHIIDVMEQKYKLYHNDLRDKNICIDKNNIIRLIDFDRTSNIQKEDKYFFKHW